jgi:hypothetical protein
MSGRSITALSLSFFALLSISSFSQIVDTTSFTLLPRLSFYSYEKSAELLLHVPQEAINNNIKVRLKYSDKILSEWNGKAENEIIRLPVDRITGLSTIRIEAEIIFMRLNSPEKNVKYISKCDFVILPHKSNEVKTDRLTGGLIVNHKQFFPFGFYCYSPVYPSLPEEEAVKGFNMISPYQKILPETLNERKAYMDRCAQIGMKVHYNLLSVSGGGGVGSKMAGITDAQKRELLTREIKTFMDHPALLAWYIADEPTGNKVTPETLEEIYKVVKETDPWHPVSIVFMAPFLTSVKYADALDIVMADPYPIPDLPASMVGEVAGKLKKEFHGEKPVWIVPQAFGGGELWSREPSLQEIRSMTYQSVINGATGIQYFVRQGLNSFPKSVPTWSECGRMALEIAELTPWLLSDEKTNPVQTFQKDIGVTSKLHNGQLIILAVNKANEPQRVEIKISGIGNEKAKVIFENRVIIINSGIISDLIPAFGSQAYLINLYSSKNEILPYSKNLIIDPGFEDISSPGAPAACYAKPGEDRGATYFLDSREHIEGNHSLRIITPKDNNSITLRFFPVTVTSGSSYLISLWAKADPEQRLSEPVSPEMASKYKNQKRQQSVEISLGGFGRAGFIPGSEWRQFVTFVTIPPDSIQHFKTNLILKMPGQGVAWFDMLQIIEDPLQSKK